MTITDILSLLSLMIQLVTAVFLVLTYLDNHFRDKK